MPENRPQPVTLREVARAAGVSTASASRALTAGGAVSADLRRRILAAADRLGYAPNLAARALAGRRSGLIGVLANNLGDHLIVAALKAFERRLAEAGYGVMIAVPPGSSAHGLSALLELLGRGAEAIVLAEPTHRLELVDALRMRGVPWIAITEEAGGDQAAVAAGRRRGAALAARYLLDLGHRRIGVIAPGATATAVGVADALTSSNVSWPADRRPVPTQDRDSAHAAMGLLLDGVEVPTAVVCASDLHALAAVRECLRRGIAVPRAISIIGFGDAEFARVAFPALTTLRVPAADLGARVAESLLLRLVHGEAPSFETPVKLVVRESTAVALC